VPLKDSNAAETLWEYGENVITAESISNRMCIGKSHILAAGFGALHLIQPVTFDLQTIKLSLLVCVHFRRQH
jgi:hypothetical protein